MHIGLPTTPFARPNWARFAVLLGLGALALAALGWSDPRAWGLPTCGFRYLTGFCCPGCGATRATHDLLHGRWLSALRCNALVVLALPLGVYWGVSESLRLAGARPLPGNRLCEQRWLVPVAAAAAVGFGVLRNIPAAPFSWLTPP